MTGKTGIHVFTEETLREHDEEIAAKVHQATVVSTTRKLLKMNSGQQLNAARNDCKSIMWNKKQLNAILDHIDKL